MGLVVNHTDFVFPYVIPNKDRLMPAFDDWVTKQERAALIKLLGFHWYNEFKDLDESRWTDLKDGKTYFIGATAYRYDGLKTVLLPLLYAKYVRTTLENTFTGVAVVRPDSENAVVIAASNVIASMINEAAEACELLEQYVTNDGRYAGLSVNKVLKTNQFGI